MVIGQPSQPSQQIEATEQGIRVSEGIQDVACKQMARKYIYIYMYIGHWASLLGIGIGLHNTSGRRGAPFRSERMPRSPPNYIRS